MGRTRAAGCVGALIFALWAPFAARGDDLPAPWVELASDGALSVRTVVAGDAACPPLTADTPGVMLTAAEPDRGFPLRVCKARVPSTTARLILGGVPLPTLPAAVRRIAVIGDTGCGLEGRTSQACNDAAAWPFPAIARLAAAKKPELVIHVGDYFYRETACPTGRAGCAGSPYGDNWATWQADFFVPAAPLLAAAPWVTTRGNHELCDRGGQGWFRLLDPHPIQLDCQARTDPYRLHLGGLDLLVFDSADADDFAAPPEKVAAYATQLASLLAEAPPHAWLITHKPIWALSQGRLFRWTIDVTEQEAIRGLVPPGLDLVLSGHVHNFTSYAFGPDRPAQLIVGDSGDTLVQTPLTDAEIDGMRVRRGFALERFGYLIMDATAGGWDGILYGSDDAVLARCQLRGRNLECGPETNP